MDLIASRDFERVFLMPLSRKGACLIVAAIAPSCVRTSAYVGGQCPGVRMRKLPLFYKIHNRYL